MSHGEHTQDVAYGGAIERGDDPDPAGHERQRPFTCAIEESLGLQPPLELLERRLQCPESKRLQRVADELILTLDLVHADAPARDHPHPVFRTKAKLTERRPEHHRPHLRRIVLQREIEVARAPLPAVRDLALDVERVERAFDRRLQTRGELADGERTPRLRPLRLVVERQRLPLVHWLPLVLRRVFGGEGVYLNGGEAETLDRLRTSCR